MSTNKILAGYTTDETLIINKMYRSKNPRRQSIFTLIGDSKNNELQMSAVSLLLQNITRASLVAKAAWKQQQH